MRILFLLRHAKAKDHSATKMDFDRPLKHRGVRAATLTGKFMQRNGIRPDLVLSSPAERAVRTAALALESAAVHPDVRLDPQIYNASWSSILELISQVENSVESLLLVGHNPGMADTLEKLTGTRVHMPTGALAKIVLQIENWSSLQETTGSVEFLTTPDELEGEAG